MTTDRCAELSQAGVSIWLDDLDRGRLVSGGLAELVATSSVVGVTTNPSIFEKAIGGDSEHYQTQIRDLAIRDVTVDEAVRAMTTTDVRWACEVLKDVHERTHGVDGRVSIEVDPRFASDTEATIAEARHLHWAVDRGNVLIKVPATLEGLPAITTLIGEGISVNVTLIFSVDRYRAVLDAWLSGLELARDRGLDLSTIESVASFFVSRVDTEVDKRLGSDSPLRGTAAIANARIAYEAFTHVVASDRWASLEAAGAHVQRPLWASTGVKDPAYSDTRYVDQLVTANVVNTMPEATLDAVRDHAVISGDTITVNIADAHAALSAISAAGVDLKDVVSLLEREGVEKFISSWENLLGAVESALGTARTAAGR
jgi:transaldolase